MGLLGTWVKYNQNYLAKIIFIYALFWELTYICRLQARSTNHDIYLC